MHLSSETDIELIKRFELSYQRHPATRAEVPAKKMMMLTVSNRASPQVRINGKRRVCHAVESLGLRDATGEITTRTCVDKFANLQVCMSAHIILYT